MSNGEIKHTKQPANAFDDDPSLRPATLAEFVGQEQLKRNMWTYIEAARKGKRTLDHVLLSGPPGLGKTTMAVIIAHELNVGFYQHAAPTLEKPGDLVSILLNLQPHDVLFIDEIHRLRPNIEEFLYPAMEDMRIDIVLDSGVGARSVNYRIAPFTLIGATTRVGMLTGPMRTRFGIVERIDFYPPEELKTIVIRSSKILRVKIDENGVYEIAKRSRGTPRLVNRYLRRLRDFAQVHGNGCITNDSAVYGFKELDIDESGLTRLDRAYLNVIIEHHRGGPVGIDTIAATLSEDSGTLEDEIEPYLLRLGFINRTPRGRTATEKAFRFFGKLINSSESQEKLF